MAQLAVADRGAQSEISAATAKHEEAQQASSAPGPRRSRDRHDRSLERAQRDATVAKRTLEALGHRRNTLDVELVSLEQGIFVGDSYNDRPQSLQRADEIALRLSEVASDIRQRQARLASLRTEIAEEKAALSRRSHGRARRAGPTAASGRS